MTFTAAAGRAGDLAALLGRVAEVLDGAPGLRQWLVARDPSGGEDVWVVETWDDAAAADAALAAAGTGDGPSPAEVLALCAGPPRRVDLSPEAGVGLA